MEAAALHHAINHFHWSPAQIDEWFNASSKVKAFYYASIQLEIEKNNKDVEEIKRLRKK